MNLIKVTPMRRRKTVGSIGEYHSDVRKPNVYFRWDHARKEYRFVLELPRINPTGETYEVDGQQLEWEAIIELLQKRMGEAPASE